MSVGRNQLCPCGSGNKYKKCCGVVTSIEQLRAAKEQRLRGEYSAWIERLNRCVPYYLDAVGLDWAKQRFAAETGLSLKDVSSPEWMPHVLNWLVFDADGDGATLLERFLRREGRRMEREQQEAFRRLSLGVYEIAGQAQDAYLVRDLTRGGERLVVGIGGVKPRPGQILIARLLPLGQRDQLFSGSMILLPRAREQLVRWLTDRQGAELRGGAVLELYRLVVRLTREFASSREPSSRQPSGLPLVRRVYRIGERRNELAAVLESNPSFAQKQQMDEREIWVFSVNREEVRVPALGKAVLELREVCGEVLLADGTAVVEGVAAQVDAAAELLALAGPYEEQDAFALTSTGKALTAGTLYVTSRPMLPANVLKWAVRAYHAEKWLVTPHPALGGLSPLAAASRKADETKETLLRLVRQLEREAELGAGPGSLMRVEEIRPRLGLPHQTLHPANLLSRPLLPQVPEVGTPPAWHADLEQFVAEMTEGKSEATVRKYDEVAALFRPFAASLFGAEFRWEALRPEEVAYFLVFDVPRRVDSLSRTLANHLLSVLAALFKWLKKRHAASSLSAAMQPLLGQLKEELPEAYRVRAVLEKAADGSWSGTVPRPGRLVEDRLLVLKQESGGWRVRRENGEEALLSAEGDGVEQLSAGWLLAGLVEESEAGDRIRLVGVPEVCPPAVACMLESVQCQLV